MNKPLKMLDLNTVEGVCMEWLRGCTCAPKGKPWECAECTEGFHKRLIELTGEPDRNNGLP